MTSNQGQSSKRQKTDQDHLSANETEIYDRQIRLWGVEAQKRIRNANVLIVGLNGVGVEISKNLVLAGINLSVFDNNIAREEDLGSNFYLRESAIGKEIAAGTLESLKSLNPLANVELFVPESSKSFTEVEISKFNAVCFCASPREVSISNFVVGLSKNCRKMKVPIIMSMSFGLSAVCFMDLGNEHSFIMTKNIGKNGEKDEIKEEKNDSFCSLETVLKLDWTTDNFPTSRRKKVDPTFYSFASLVLDEAINKASSDKEIEQNLEKIMSEKNYDAGSKLFEAQTVVQNVKHFLNKTEIAPVSAVLGGIIGQEIVKIVSKKDRPINNFFFFDAILSQGVVRKIDGK